MKYGIITFLLIQAVFSKIENSETDFLCINKEFSFVSNKDDYITCARFGKEEGWHILTLETSQSEKYDNKLKMLSAGFIEGYIYHEYIDYHYQNIFQTIFKKTPIKETTRIFVDGGLEFARESCKKDSIEFLGDKTDKAEKEYYETLCLVLEQFRGLYLGYKAAPSSNAKLSEEDFYLLTMQADLEDIIPAFEPERLKLGLFRKEKDCSGFIKLVGANLIVGHNTHNLYSLMNRIYKYYNFNITLSTGRKVNNFKFSSRPGDLNSKDDYYVLSNKMVVLETSLEVKNFEIYKNLEIKTLPKWIRVNLANRLCEDNISWIETFFKHNSGTHNNQWLITDYKAFNKFLKGESEIKGVVHLVEQTPMLYKKYFEDLTEILVKQSYLASYNAPYFEEVAESLGIPKKEDYNHARRKTLFEEQSAGVTCIEAAKKVLRFHSKEDICDTIAPRCDLVQGRPFGAVDAKITDSHMVEKLDSIIVYGPPFIDGVTQPFDFSVYEDYSHLGIPEKFKFDWIVA